MHPYLIQPYSGLLLTVTHPYLKQPYTDLLLTVMNPHLKQHLCGLATDLALRSLESLREIGRVEPKNEMAENVLGSAVESECGAPSSVQLSRMARGVAIATCCHHACSWKDYTGKAFLRAHSFSSAEFEVTLLLVSVTPYELSIAYQHLLVEVLSSSHASIITRTH